MSGSGDRIMIIFNRILSPEPDIFQCIEEYFKSILIILKNGTEFLYIVLTSLLLFSELANADDVGRMSL